MNLISRYLLGRYLRNSCLRLASEKHNLKCLYECRYSTSTSKEELTNVYSHTSDYVTVYKNSALPYGGLLIKAFKYPTLVSIGAIPITGSLYAAEIIPLEMFQGYSLFAVWVVLLSQIITLHFWKTIGFVYIDEAKENVKIAYLTYFGKRKDIIVALKDVKHFSDVPSFPTDYIFTRVQIFGYKGSYKMYSGQIFNEEIFYQIFGERSSVK